MIRRTFFLFLLFCTIAPAFADGLAPALLPPSEADASLPDAPSALTIERTPVALALPLNPSSTPSGTADPNDPFSAPHPELMGTPQEPYHWKGLLLQSLSFNLLLNGARTAFSTQNERKLLLNKPFWSDYWASLGQYNMRRWNDGDPIAMNYIGHPVEGAVAGYLEIQNNPRDRALQMGDQHYWSSRFRAFAWATAFSTQWEIGPLGEAAIFNQGGFTYAVHCRKNCSPTEKITNNTGWVDFVITPTIGTLWIVGEDALDKYVTDPLVRRHPHNFGYKVLRSSANPSRSLANMLRGREPWYRDYEHRSSYESRIIGPFENALKKEPNEHIDLFTHYTAYSIRRNKTGCMGCRGLAPGAGLGIGVRVFRYLDFVTDLSFQPEASPLSSFNIGGSLFTGNFGIRSGYNGKRFKLRASLAPGFASYSRAQDLSTAKESQPNSHRSTNFQAAASAEADVKLAQHFGLRIGVQNMLIRYKSPIRDPEGIGTLPDLNFLSHDNYINSTNWGMKVGPVFYF
jgi:hypothetical protein